MEYYERARPDRAARGARLPPRRLRLHDVHRQLRAAAGGDLRRRQRRGPRGRLRAERQPQLRGPHQPRREDELPRVAAARASPTRSRGRWTSTCSTSRSGRTPTASDVYLKDIWPSRRGGRARRSRRPCRSDMFTQVLRRGLRGRRALELARGARGRPLRLGRTTRPTCASPPFFEDLPREPAAVARHRGRARARLLGDSVTTDHISPAGAIKKDSPAGAVPQRARRRAARTSTPTARAAATTR